MNEKPTIKYPDIEKVIESIGEIEKPDESFLIVNNTGDDKTYTFETHPFYSQLEDYSELDIPESDIY